MKKKVNANKLDEILQKIKTQERPELNEKEIELIQAALLIDGQHEKVYNALYYRYEKPDYGLMSPTARSWLLPFCSVLINLF